MAKEEPGWGRRSQEEPGGARRSEGEPGGARKSQKRPGGARTRRGQEEPGGALLTHTCFSADARNCTHHLDCLASVGIGGWLFSTHKILGSRVEDRSFILHRCLLSDQEPASVCPCHPSKKAATFKWSKNWFVLAAGGMLAVRSRTCLRLPLSPKQKRCAFSLV